MAKKTDLYARCGGAALITGASSGLGEAFAKRLARAGFDVVLVARRRDRMEHIACAIRQKTNARCVIVETDLSVPGSVDDLFNRIAEEKLDLGFIVNNAGFGTFRKLDLSDSAEQLSMVDLNCRAVLEIAHRGAGILKQRRRGAMIITSSVLGHFSLPRMATYSATKAFDLSLAEALWAELRPHGVDVQALCPGPTQTEFHTRAGSPTRTGLRSMTCAEVVDISLRKLGRGPVVIPGFRNRLLVGAMRVMPASLRMRLLSLASRVGKNRAS